MRDEAALIRFAEGPSGEVVPDLGRKLPGRGLWVAADRASIDKAVKRGLFARAARKKVTAEAGLADRVEAMLRARLLAGLGLARRAGALTCGYESVRQSIVAQRTAVLVEAADGSGDGRSKLIALSRHAVPPPKVVGIFSGAEMDLALGLENVVHTALLVGRAAQSWTADLDRLAGFRPLLPEAWLTMRVGGP